MNLRQLRYVKEVAANGLSVSGAAKTLHTSQPGVSQQIRLLEDELGVRIFAREKNRLVGLTAEGSVIVERIAGAVADIDYTLAFARAKRADRHDEVVVITSHTQARYVLPKVLESFAASHPGVKVNVRHGNSAEMMGALAARACVIGVIPGELVFPGDLLALPYAQYRRIVVVPKGHPLLSRSRPTLQMVARYPLVTYEQSISARQVIIEAFRKAGAEPQIILSAIDADVIKACVERKLGIAVLPEIVFDPARDADLRVLATGELFPPSVASIVLHRRRPLQACEYDFIQLLAPQWTRRRIENTMRRTPAGGSLREQKGAS